MVFKRADWTKYGSSNRPRIEIRIKEDFREIDKFIWDGDINYARQILEILKSKYGFG